MKLNIIKTNRGYVTISDEQPSQKHTRTEDEGKWVVSLFNSWVGQLSMEYRGLWRIEWEVSPTIGNLLSDPHPSDNYRMIVATDTTFKLSGIPQFELENLIDDEPLAEADFKHLGYKTGKQDFKVGFVRGYRSAQEKGCYTIEDMRQAYDSGKQRQFWEEDYKEGSKILEQNALNFDNFIESLNQPKKLVAIEVETERRNVLDLDERGLMGYTTITDFKKKYPDIKKHPDGLLTIKEYFYDNK